MARRAVAVALVALLALVEPLFVVEEQPGSDPSFGVGDAGRGVRADLVVFEVGAFRTTPDPLPGKTIDGGGIWQGAVGLAADPWRLRVPDRFMPYRKICFDENDLDLSAQGRW